MIRPSSLTAAPRLAVVALSLVAVLQDEQAAAIRQSTFEFIPYLYAERVYAIRPGIEGVHLWTGYFTISFKEVRVS